MEHDIGSLLRASLADIRRGERALAGACAFGGDVRAWCRQEGVAVRAHVHAAAVVLGLTLPRAVEAAGGGPELLGRLAGLALGRERAELVRVHARWLVSRDDAEQAEARRAWARGAVATDPRTDVADALRKEIARAMAIAEIELRAGVAHCLRIGVRPAELRRVADVPNLSALLARSSSFVDLVRRIKAGRRPDKTVRAGPLPTPEEVRDPADAGTLFPAGAESTDASDTDLSLSSKIVALALMGAPLLDQAEAASCPGIFVSATCSGAHGTAVCTQDGSTGVITCDVDRSSTGTGAQLWATSETTDALVVYGIDSDGDNFCCDSGDFTFTSTGYPLDIVGGSGDDRLAFFDVNTGYDLECSDASIDGGAGNDSLVGSMDTTYGDLIYGGANNDNIVGNAGPDVLYGEADVDTIYGGDGDDTMDGGTEADTMYGDNNNDTMNGGTGDDTMQGGANNDTMDGDDGNDKMTGNGGNDQMTGDLGNDEMKGGTGDDTMDGFTGNDKLCGGDNNDSLYGDYGDDYVIGEGGTDINDGGNDYDYCENESPNWCDDYSVTTCPIGW